MLPAAGKLLAPTHLPEKERASSPRAIALGADNAGLPINARYTPFACYCVIDELWKAVSCALGRDTNQYFSQAQQICLSSLTAAVHSYAVWYVLSFRLQDRS